MKYKFLGSVQRVVLNCRVSHSTISTSNEGRRGNESLTRHMEFNRVVDCIRMIEYGDLSSITELELEYLATILNDHGCYYLLSKIRDVSYEIIKNGDVVEYSLKVLGPVFKELENKKVPYAFLKGPLLSFLAYNNVDLRRFRDFDILVDSSCLGTLENILYKNGFKSGSIVKGRFVEATRMKKLFYATNTHQVMPYVLETGNSILPFIEIDVNKSILWGEAKQQININQLIGSSCQNYVLNETKCVSFDIILFFISLCLHHYKDMNSPYILFTKNRISLRRICDVFYYIKNNQTNMSAIDLVNTCNKLNVAKYVYYMIYSCNLVFNANFLDEYLLSLYSDTYEDLIDTFGLKNNEIYKWNISFYERIFGNNLKDYITCNVSESCFNNIIDNQKYLND